MRMWDGQALKPTAPYLSMTTGQPPARVAVALRLSHLYSRSVLSPRSSRLLPARSAHAFVYPSHACPLSGVWYPICRYQSSPSPSSASRSPTSNLSFTTSTIA
jgi:hypothetical protein